MECSPRSRTQSSGLLSCWVNTPHDESLLNNEQFIFALLSQRPRLQRAASLWLWNEDVPGKQRRDKATYFDNIAAYIAGCDYCCHCRGNLRLWNCKVQCYGRDLVSIFFFLQKQIAAFLTWILQWLCQSHCLPKWEQNHCILTVLNSEESSASRSWSPSAIATQGDVLQIAGLFWFTCSAQLQHLLAKMYISKKKKKWMKNIFSSINTFHVCLGMYFNFPRFTLSVRSRCLGMHHPAAWRRSSQTCSSSPPRCLAWWWRRSDVERPTSRQVSDQPHLDVIRAWWTAFDFKTLFVKWGLPTNSLSAETSSAQFLLLLW